ncbi:MAG: ThuA domain-containing protein [Balneolaceae bacterium]|nr:ThuA domain-containing protein [Balneolaceae bacterium]
MKPHNSETGNIEPENKSSLKGRVRLILSSAFFLLIFLAGAIVFWQISADSDTTGTEGPELHIHFISGSAEYESEASLKDLKQLISGQHSQIKITASWGEDQGSDLPDIEQLEMADLMVVFTRRMTLPKEQLQYIQRHIEAEKPVLGIRTASHAFQDLLEMDELVLGGDYDGHGDDETVDVRIADEAAGHSVLKGVDDEWNRPGKIYHNPSLGTNAVPLLYGRGEESGIDEPLAWANIYGENGRAFYTSMGLPSDFENEYFLQMLFNAISWTTGYPLLSPKIDAFEPGSYQIMDYGPVLSESIKMEWPSDALVRKGLAIRLDHDAAMVFDTDLVRFAAGTVGGWLDISQTDYTSYKGSDIASIEGRQVFATSEIAGWAKEGSFYGPRDDGLGNLPHDWAHYKGFYRYGNQVVLSYTVGETNLLELPGIIRYGDSPAFMRTLQADASEGDMKALIAEKRDNWVVETQSDEAIIFSTGDAAFAVRLFDAGEDVKLVESDGRVELHLPSSRNARSVRVLMFEMNSADDTLFENFGRMMAQKDLPDLKAKIQGGSSRWSQELAASGELDERESGYVIDRIPVPFDNPWKSWMRLSGLDFFEDGSRAAVSTWNGDVWIVSGLNDSLEEVTWQRFASGLFYPMGVAVVDDEIYVTERSQLTRLRDLNGNGEADFYENFNNDGIVYPMAHTLELQVDSEGNFYFFKNGNRVPPEIPQHGSLIRVSADGSEREIFARGYRGANSLGIGPDDQILGADQEGNWVPVDRFDVLEKGGFYGDRRHGGENLEVGDFDPPVAWMPYHVNNSTGPIIYAGDSRWGPLAGQWILGSYSQRTLFTVLKEEMNGRYQGGIVKLPVESSSGLVRGQMNPHDGQLYVTGLRGWQTLATDDGGFERIRYAGGSANLPKHFHVSPEGVRIVFTDPLDPDEAQNIQNYQAERWGYVYSARYGSPEVLPDDPDTEGRESVEILSAEISEDRTEVFLEIRDMKSVMQMKIAYNLLFEDGEISENAIYHTVNWLTPDEAADRPEWQQEIISRSQDQEEVIVQRADDSTEEDRPEWYREGAISFQRNCAACHVSGGVAPSMDRSEWAGGSHEALVRIVLQGKRGERGVMTPFSWMNDEEIAAVISYIRANWHDEEPVAPSQIEEIRQTTGERTELWTEEELRVFFD